MVTILIDNRGEKRVDPHNNSGQHLNWRKKITKANGEIDYHAFTTLPKDFSEYLIRYTLDLELGRNLAKGKRKGARSLHYLVSNRNRLKKTFELMQEYKPVSLLEMTEDYVLEFFKLMRNGTIKASNGKVYTAPNNYSKLFFTFWSWLMRVKKKDGIILNDIVVDLDTHKDIKPRWHYFTLSDVEKMADVVSGLYYKSLMFFLFDAGLRPPTELMNVRRKDITPIPESEYFYLDIRDETSKTFGRKIKLMICSPILKRYLASRKFEPDDFIWDKSYPVTSRIIARAGFKALGIGTKIVQKNGKVLTSGGISMYHFRHNSVCHYLPIYQSENQMKYRYGWNQAKMIHYYSEYMGMRDTISEDQMLIDSSKTQLQTDLEKEKRKVLLIQEQMEQQKKEMDERMKKMEAMMLQKFADS